MNFIEQMGGREQAAAALAPLLRGLWHPQFRGRVCWESQASKSTNESLRIALLKEDTLATIERRLQSEKTDHVPLRVSIEKLGDFVFEKAADSSQELSGKVAMVTGGAQGFGEGIARGLAERGAWIVIADINAEKATEVCQSINETLQRQAAVSIPVDVGDERSVENLMIQCAHRFGGLDLLVSNAGVLRAGGLEDLSLEDFQLVTRINYTAFFLVTKYGARLMKRQTQAAPAYHADIIQINSKSGLEGSNRNFAYAGSKFGGIGLVQSFAKELVEDRIKVNAICPGNYYEGPLWSDPDRGLFVQYLRAGKIPGAQTVDDVYRAYVDKVPMRRGCLPQDVVRAIAYCISQTYETGQAIPVTGGQTMLS